MKLPNLFSTHGVARIYYFERYLIQLQYSVNKLYDRLLREIKAQSFLMSTCVAVMKLNSFFESSRIYNNYFVITSSCLSFWNHYVSLVTLGPTAHTVSLMTSTCLFKYIESPKAPKTIPYQWSCLGLLFSKLSVGCIKTLWLASESRVCISILKGCLTVQGERCQWKYERY